MGNILGMVELYLKRAEPNLRFDLSTVRKFGLKDSNSAEFG